MIEDTQSAAEKLRQSPFLHADSHIGHHCEPPAGLFENASPPARVSGYRMFRTRLFNDQLGWYASGLEHDDGARAELYTKGYRSGLAEDYNTLKSPARSAIEKKKVSCGKLTVTRLAPMRPASMSPLIHAKLRGLGIEGGFLVSPSSIVRLNVIDRSS
jgi:hypothetical protein